MRLFFSFVKLIHREILMHRQLKHKNVIPLVGVFVEDVILSAPLIVLPYFKNGSAKAWLSLKGNMTMENYERIVGDLPILCFALL